MNVEQAKTIPLFEILDKLGFKPARQTKKDAYYHYPEKKKGKKPNFHVNLKKNVWYDHRLKRGGTIIDFAIAYLQDNNRPHSTSDALTFIETTMGHIPTIPHCMSTEQSPTEQRYTISSFNKITDPALIEEIETKGISLKLAQKYMDEVNVYDHNKKHHFLALAFENDDEGYLVENKYISIVLDGRPDVTFIRGEITGPPYIHVFKDRWDFLSLLEYQNVPELKYDALILNDYSGIWECPLYFYQSHYRVVFTYLPNTPDGAKATEELVTIFNREADLVHRPMNSLYPPPYETLNEWWQQKKLSLSE